MENDAPDQIKSELLEGPLPALHLEAEHEPTPAIDGYPNPSGDGELVAIQTGPEEWAIRTFDGPHEKAARHSFDSIRGFVGWLKRWTPRAEAAQVFASVASSIMASNMVGRKLEAYVDPRDPGCDSAVGRAPLEARFAAWISLARDGVKLNQKTFFTFIREFGDVIQGEGVAEHLLASLAALRVTSTENLEAEFAPNGRLKVSGARGDVTISQELPSELIIRLPVYFGVHWFPPSSDEELTAMRAEYEIRVVLEVNAGPQYHGLQVEMSFPGIQNTMADADEDLVNHIQHELGQGFLVCAGSPERVDVPVRSGRANADSEFLDDPLV